MNFQMSNSSMETREESEFLMESSFSLGTVFFRLRLGFLVVSVSPLKLPLLSCIQDFDAVCVFHTGFIIFSLVLNSNSGKSVLYFGKSAKNEKSSSSIFDFP